MFFEFYNREVLLLKACINYPDGKIFTNQLKIALLISGLKRYSACIGGKNLFVKAASLKLTQTVA